MLFPDPPEDPDLLAQDFIPLGIIRRGRTERPTQQFLVFMSCEKNVKGESTQYSA